MSQQVYETVMNEHLPIDDRLRAFAKRAAWVRPLGNGSYQDQINNLVKDIAQMGIVEMRDGPNDQAGFPSILGVEQLPPDGGEIHPHLATVRAEDFEDVDLTTVEKARHLSRRHRE